MKVHYFALRPRLVAGSPWKVAAWQVQQLGFFGWKTKASFDDRPKAWEYCKRLADQNRPSQATIYDAKGEVVWSHTCNDRPRILQDSAIDRTGFSRARRKMERLP